MAPPVYVLYAHGVGDRTPADFATDAHRTFSRAMVDRLTAAYGQSVHWGPVLDKYQDRAASGAKRLGSAMRPIQRLTNGVAADALSFRWHEEEVFEVFDRAFVRLRAPDEIVLVAHSLGCLLSIDWLRARPQVKVCRFVTMGCNLALFYQGCEAALSGNLPKQLTRPGVWNNVVYRADGLGWPIGHWLPARDRFLPKPFWSWSTIARGLSHTDYWTDSHLFGQVLPDLLAEAP